MLLYVIAGIVCVVGYLLYRSIYLVQQAEVVIIERFGQFHTILTPGLHVIVPLIDAPRVSFWVFVQEVDKNRYYRMTRAMTRIDLRETVYDFPRQQVITRDNVVMEVSAMLYYQIIDAHAAVYGVMNLPEAIERLAHSTLRNVIGELDLDETSISRDRINHKLREILDEATHKWGVKVNRVELQEVTPPQDIRHAMEKQMRAERERRAVIKEAEGVKAAAILEAEGRQQAQILAADGAAQARIIAADAEAKSRLVVAEAEAQALTKIRSALGNADPVQFVVAQQYVAALAKIAEGKDNKLVVVPYEAAGLVNAATLVKTLTQQ